MGSLAGSVSTIPPAAARRRGRPKPYSYARVVQRLGRPLGLACVVLGLVILLGYAINAEPLFRPISGGPATSPLTALTVVILGGAMSITDLRHRGRSAALIAAAVLILGLRLFDGWFGTDVVGVLMPFHGIVAAQLALGQSNSMGTNTAIMLLVISLSHVLSTWRKPVLSQILGFLALALPVISMTGYAYGLMHFYGQMSLTTTSLGIMLALAVLSLSPHRGMLWAILAPHIGGRIARLQVLLGYLVPFGLGFLLLRSAKMVAGADPLGLFIVAMSWFAIGLAAVSAVFQERSDRRRRIVEAADHFAAANDTLTHLANRRKFFDVGGREWVRILRHSGDLSILMIDIDHFKRVNDTVAMRWATGC